MAHDRHPVQARLSIEKDGVSVRKMALNHVPDLQLICNFRPIKDILQGERLCLTVLVVDIDGIGTWVNFRAILD